MSQVCPLISQGHLIKGSFNLMGGNPSWLVTPHVKCGGCRDCGSGDIMLLVAEKEDS